MILSLSALAKEPVSTLERLWRRVFWSGNRILPQRDGIMRIPIVYVMGALAVAGIAFAAGWPYLRMAFASSAYYREQDKRAYEYYTPDSLKKIPRISNNYNFEFGRTAGSEAHVFTVKFYGVVETQRIRDYLKSAGCKPQESCDVEAECWQSPATRDEVTVGNLHSTKGVLYRYTDACTRINESTGVS